MGDEDIAFISAEYTCYLPQDIKNCSIAVLPACYQTDTLCADIKFLQHFVCIVIPCGIYTDVDTFYLAYLFKGADSPYKDRHTAYFDELFRLICILDPCAASTCDYSCEYHFITPFFG